MLIVAGFEFWSILAFYIRLYKVNHSTGYMDIVAPLVHEHDHGH